MALLQVCRSVEIVMLTGRWRSLESARLYLRQGEALLARFLGTQSVFLATRLAALRFHAARSLCEVSWIRLFSVLKNLFNGLSSRRRIGIGFEF